MIVNDDQAVLLAIIAFFALVALFMTGKPPRLRP